MKGVHNLLVATLVLALTQAANAQFNLGIMGGANLANFSATKPVVIDAGDNEMAQGSFTSRTAAGFGVVLDYSFSPRVTLSIQPMFAQHGSKLQLQDPVPDGVGKEHNVKLSYFDIPVMFKVNLGSAGVRPYVTSGFTFGFLASAKTQAAGKDANKQDVDVKSSFKSTNFAWNIGGGLGFAAGKSTIFIEGRYLLGLTNVRKGSGAVPLSVERIRTDEAKTRGVQILAGVSFPLGAR